MNLFWTENCEIPSFKELKGDIKTDVLVIGGGITGILCAHELAARNIDYVLLEGAQILSGNSGNTTAKITAGHGSYAKLAKKHGMEFAKKYYTANSLAIEKYINLSRQYPCDLEIKDFYMYSIQDAEKAQAEYRVLSQIGADVQFSETEELPFSTQGAVMYKNQAQFNPVMLLSAMAQRLKIYENSFVHTVTDDTALCKNGSVKFKKVIFATHFPFLDRYGLYFLKMYQHRSYVTVFDNAPELKGMYADFDSNGFSFRNYKGRLVVAGGGAKTGKKCGGYRAVENTVKQYFPKAQPRFHFAAQDCMTLDGAPYIGRYCKSKENYFAATGFNAWGMTSALISASLLCDLITDTANTLCEIYSPQRSMLEPQLLVNAATAAYNLLTPTAPRCSHLGCALKWNKHEKSWDCPCHGSRFTKDGEVIDNPSTKNLK